MTGTYKLASRVARQVGSAKREAPSAGNNDLEPRHTTPFERGRYEPNRRTSANVDDVTPALPAVAIFPSGWISMSFSLCA